MIGVVGRENIIYHKTHFYVAKGIIVLDLDLFYEVPP